MGNLLILGELHINLIGQLNLPLGYVVIDLSHLLE
jgi:hypothetical protein